MKVLFIGGTGNISSAVSRLAISKGIDLTLLQRGNRGIDIPGVTYLMQDINQSSQVAAALKGQQFDVVVNWINFKVADIERDIELFRNIAKQYIFISSASVYQKPLEYPVITESTPLCNPFWEYSRNKIACEERLMQAYRNEGFPVTIVRPSHTYDTVFPVALGSWNDFTIVDRMRRDGKIIVHGDGSSIWTITHSEDFAKGFIGLLGNSQAIGEAFHITSDELLTWNQIYQTLANAAGAEANIIHIPSDFIVNIEPEQCGNLYGDKMGSTIFDNTKIKRFVLDFKATIPFSEGIRRTIAWYEADPARMRIINNNNAMLDRIIAAYERR